MHNGSTQVFLVASVAPLSDISARYDEKKPVVVGARNKLTGIEPYIPDTYYVILQAFDPSTIGAAKLAHSIANSYPLFRHSPRSVGLPLSLHRTRFCVQGAWGCSAVLAGRPKRNSPNRFPVLDTTLTLVIWFIY